MSPEARERRKAYQREYQRLRRLEPAVQAQEKIRKSQPNYKAQRCEYARQRYLRDPAYRQAKIDRIRTYRQDPAIRAAVNEQARRRYHARKPSTP